MAIAQTPPTARSTPRTLPPTSPSGIRKPADGAKPVTYHRVLLKLSGEAFCSPGGQGIDPAELDLIAAEVKEAHKTGVQLAVVVGGGNFVRGAKFAQAAHINQSTADYMGMLATVLNGLALKEALLHIGVDSRVMSAIEIRSVAETFILGRALRHFDKGRIVILVAGTGNPYFTTDTCAALRATELECGLLMKATKVDGVYSANPHKDPKAVRYDRLTFDEAIAKNLGVMDMTAITMCREQNIPVLVFDFKVKGNIARAIAGAGKPGGGGIGTLVHNG